MTVSVRVDGSELRAFVSRVGRVPDAVARRLRPKLRRAGDVVKAGAASRASWSSRIPGALFVRVNLTGGSSTGVRVGVRESQAPHARPYEGILGNSMFRHPLFGNYDRWFDEATRPFLAPAAQAARPQVLREVADAVDEAYADLRLT